MRVELEGELCVTISNDSGEISSLCSLKYLRVAPEFTSAPVESLSVYVGSSLVLGCEFTGIPVPTVKWLKDRVAISKGDVTENEAITFLISNYLFTNVPSVNRKSTIPFFRVKVNI